MSRLSSMSFSPHPGNLWCIIPHKGILHNIMLCLLGIQSLSDVVRPLRRGRFVCMCVNVTDTLWQGHQDRVMQLNLL